MVSSPDPSDDEVIELTFEEPSSEVEIELSLDGLETLPSDSPEIVLDVAASSELENTGEPDIPFLEEREVV